MSRTCRWPTDCDGPTSCAHTSILDLNPGERSALKNLTAEEREAVIDELLVQAREDLEWVVARAAVAAEQAPPRERVSTPPPLPPLGTRIGKAPTRPPARRPAPRSWINR